MQESKLQSKPQNFRVLSLILGTALIVSVIGNVWLLQKNNSDETGNNIQDSGQGDIGTREGVSVKEIYPLFECPCCGSAIDQCTCPMAKERKTYIDGLAAGQMTEEEMMFVYVQRYGLDSFIDKDRQEEFRAKLIEKAPADRPIISITPVSYDFGELSQKEGKVYTFFELKNEGKSDLVINKLSTSCGCTFVSIIYQGEESPAFTMEGHGSDAPEWEGVSIAPDKTAQLKVMYDPSVHKDFRGEAIREIFVHSDDPIDFEKRVSIELNQVD